MLSDSHGVGRLPCLLRRMAVDVLSCVVNWIGDWNASTADFN